MYVALSPSPNVHSLGSRLATAKLTDLELVPLHHKVEAVVFKMRMVQIDVLTGQ